MFTGSLPPASIHGTWSENLELRDIEDGTLLDLTSVTEITLKLRDPRTKLDEFTLTMSDGDIVIPVLTEGVIQWRVEADQMGTLDSKLYEAILIIEDEDDALPLVLGTISVVE